MTAILWLSSVAQRPSPGTARLSGRPVYGLAPTDTWVRVQPSPRLPRHPPIPIPRLPFPVWLAAPSGPPTPLPPPLPSAELDGGRWSHLLLFRPRLPFHRLGPCITAAATRTAQLVPARRSRCTPPPHLCFSPPFPSLSIYLLSWCSVPGGGDLASGGAIRSLQRRAPTRYALPFSSVPAV